MIKKVFFLGKATTFVVGLAGILALSMGVASTALAGTGMGATFNLGKTNTVNAITKLVGNVPRASLVIDNNSTDPAATALNLQVEAGKAPMTVNSATKVENLNADRLDGKNAVAFLPKATYTKFAESTGSDIGGGVRLAVALCDAGDVVLSGGHSGLNAGTTLVASSPVVDAEQGWQLRWINDGTDDSMGVSVYCADYQPLH